jgi:hypothetical protein
MSEDNTARDGVRPATTRVLLVVSWLWVGAPLVYGLYELVLKAQPLFVK